MKEKEGFTFKRVMNAVMAGALVGLILFESGVVDKVRDAYIRQQIELCGPKMDHCPTPDPNDPIDPLEVYGLPF